VLWLSLVAIAAVIAGAILALRSTPNSSGSPPTNSSTSSPPVASQSTPTSPPPPGPVSTNLPQLEVKQAVIVTVELDFGPTLPSIADAVLQIERRHQPTDGQGRVFAILDAYGGPTADGKKLHIQMHVSTEKLGVGSLVFRRTGETLWSSRVVPASDGSTNVSPGGLTILLSDGGTQVFTVDGSTNPATILHATLKESGVPVAQAWPEGAEREVTFLYSACGCPVKVMCRRSGNRTVRTSDSPHIFPDDPEAVTIIRQLMAW